MKKLIVACMGLAACAALAVETRPLVIGLSDSFEPSFEGLVHEWPTMSGTALSYVDAIGKVLEYFIELQDGASPPEGDFT